MKSKIIIMLTLLLGMVLPATAEFTTVTRAHEVALSEFRAPATESGGIAFRICSSCELNSVRVTANTRYFVNEKAVSLVDFRQAIASVRKRDENIVIVNHHLESDTIVSIKATI